MGEIIKFNGGKEQNQSSTENDGTENILITLRNKYTTKYLNNLSNQFEKQEILNDFINNIGKAAFSLKDYLKNQDKISPEGQKIINPIIIEKVKETANTINAEKKDEIEKLIQENPNESLGGIVNQICCILGIIGERDSLSEEEKKEEIKKYQQILNTQISNQDIISGLKIEAPLKEVLHGKETKNSFVSDFETLLQEEIYNLKATTKEKFENCIEDYASSFSRVFNIEKQFLRGCKYPLKKEEIQKIEKEHPDRKGKFQEYQEKINQNIQKLEQYRYEIEKLEFDMASVKDATKKEKIDQDIKKKEQEIDKEEEQLKTNKTYYLSLQIEDEKERELFEKMKDDNYQFGAIGKTKEGKQTLQEFFQKLANKTYADFKIHDGNGVLAPYFQDCVNLDKKEIIFPRDQEKKYKIPIKRTFTKDPNDPIRFQLDFSNPELKEIKKELQKEMPNAFKDDLWKGNGTEMILLGLGNFEPKKIDTCTPTKEIKEVKEKSKDPINFNTEWEKAFPGVECKKGTRVWIPYGESDLPPQKDPSKAWVKAEITKVDPEYITVKYSGGELKIGELENTTQALKKENINWFNNTKYGSPFATDKTNFEDIKKQFAKAGHNIPHLDKIHIEKGKLIFNSEKNIPEEVNFFTSIDDDTCSKDAASSKVPVVYEVETKGDRITLKTNFIKDGKALEYEKDMTYDQFIVFMENKALEPQTKENGERLKKVKENDERREYTTIKTHEWKRFSINSIIAGAKKAWDSLKKGFTAEDEKNAKELEDFIFGTGDFDFYGKLRKYLGRFPGMDDYARDERGKIVDAEQKDAWDKINKYLSIFDGNPNFKNDVETVPELADVFKMSIMQEIFGGKSYKDPNTTIDDVVDLSNDKKKRPAMAAAMLAMMKKTKGLYTKMTRFEDQGMRVKMLLGESKRREYIAQRAKIEADIAAGRGDRKILQNLLARAEVEFIMNDINRDERDYFGCTKGDKNYKNNLPFAFATELDNRFKECYSTAKRDDERKEKAEQSFWIAKDSFYGNLKKGKEVYIGDLGAAMEQTKTEQDHKDIQIMMLTFLLSGKSDLNMRKENKKYFIKLARTYSFAPGLILENHDVVSYTLEFLKQIDPQLVANLKEQTKGAQTQTEEIRKILEKRFDTGDNFKKFENFLKKDFVTKQRNENPKMKEIKEKFEEDGDIDQSLKDNDDITNYRGLNSTPTAVDNARGFSKGTFTGDADAQGRKKAFWKRIKSDVESFGNTKDEIIYLYNQFTKVFFPKGSEGKRVIKLLQGNRRNKYRGKLNEFKNDIISAYFVGANIERNDVLPGEYRDALNAFIKKIKAGNNLSIIYDNCCQDCDAMSVNELVGLLTDSYTLGFKYVPYKDENGTELKRDWRKDITGERTKKLQNNDDDEEDDIPMEAYDVPMAA